MGRGDLLTEYQPESAPAIRRERATGPGRRAKPLRALPMDRDRESLLEIRDPTVVFDELLLPDDVRGLFAEVHLEHANVDRLAGHGLLPRRRFLHVGPPGCGKTATAEALADELGLRLATVSLPAIVSSFLGDTSKNLSSVFEIAASNELVILFDEFDAIAKTRDDEAEHGELRRVVTSFLQLLDRFLGPSVIVAASNHPQLLDSAVWRRFDEVISFQMPSVHDIRALIRLELRTVERVRGFDVEQIAAHCKHLSHAEVVRVLQDARRHHVLHAAPRSQLSTEEVVSAALRAQQRAQTRE